MFKKREGKKRTFTISELNDQNDQEQVQKQPDDQDEEVQVLNNALPSKRQKIGYNSTKVQQEVSKNFILREVDDLTKVQKAPAFSAETNFKA